MRDILVFSKTINNPDTQPTTLNKFNKPKFGEYNMKKEILGNAFKRLAILLVILFVISVIVTPVIATSAKNKFMQADFSASPTSGHKPLAVHFTDHSKSHLKVLYWSWSFGDKSTSSLKNPTHVYKNPGRYTVSLTVKCPHGVIDTKKVYNYIKVIK